LDWNRNASRKRGVNRLSTVYFSAAVTRMSCSATWATGSMTGSARSSRAMPISRSMALTPSSPVALACLSAKEDGLQFRRMLAPGLVPVRVVGERRERHADLVRHERDHRLWWAVAGTETLAGVAQEAELHGKPETVHAASLGSDECEVIGAQHVVARHLGRVGWDSEQAVALLRGEQGAAGHGGLVLDGRRHS
jgi:hypothetical protein